MLASTPQSRVQCGPANRSRSGIAAAPRAPALRIPSKQQQRPSPRRAVTAAAGADATTLAEVVLGSTAVLGGLTFGLAPRFRELFKEDVDWKQIFAQLTEEGVDGVSVEEAARLIAASSDVVLLDVRPADDFDAVRAPGAVNVPLYIPIQKWDAPSVIRRAAFAFFGIAGTEPNPSFDSDALAALEGKRRALVVCATGGSLTAKEGAAWGFSSRSLKAIWRLRNAGARVQLNHVRGGMREWIKGGRGELSTVGTDGAYEDEAEAMADLRETLGVKVGSGGGGEARSASPFEGAFAAVRGLFSKGE